jgi:Co/Zn/Cd efflux system component
MSAHAIVPDTARHQRVLSETQHIMREFGVGHVTLQIEREELCQETHP